MKKPQFRDYNQVKNGFSNALDGYASDLDKYCDQLEKELKELKMENGRIEILLITTNREKLTCEKMLKKWQSV